MLVGRGARLIFSRDDGYALNGRRLQQQQYFQHAILLVPELFLYRDASRESRNRYLSACCERPFCLPIHTLLRIFHLYDISLLFYLRGARAPRPADARRDERTYSTVQSKINMTITPHAQYQ